MTMRSELYRTEHLHSGASIWIKVQQAAIPASMATKQGSFADFLAQGRQLPIDRVVRISTRNRIFDLLELRGELLTQRPERSLRDLRSSVHVIRRNGAAGASLNGVAGLHDQAGVIASSTDLLVATTRGIFADDDRQQRSRRRRVTGWSAPSFKLEASICVEQRLVEGNLSTILEPRVGRRARVGREIQGAGRFASFICGCFGLIAMTGK